MPMDTETYLRFKLITAFNGDIVKAETALKFVKGNPEASEEYRRFKLWKDAEYENYCKDKGIMLGINPTSPEEQ